MARTRLRFAAHKVRKLKPADGSAAAADHAAQCEAAKAAAAAALDCALRRACATASGFARACPAALPLGGSVHELSEYRSLWTTILAVAGERGAADPDRGGSGLAVRDVTRMLPLTPSARLGLYASLSEHVQLHARLHESLKRYRDPSRPSDESVPLLDGTTLDMAVDAYEDQLLEGLRDAQWRVRSQVVSALTIFVQTGVEEDHPMLLADALQVPPRAARAPRPF